MIRETDITTVHPDCRETHVDLAALSIPSLDDLGLVMAGYGRERTAYEIKRPARQRHQLLMSLSGRGWALINNKMQRVKQFTYWFCPHGTPQHYRMDGPAWELLWFTFEPGHSCTDTMVRNGHRLYPSRWGRALRAAVRGIHREQQENLPGKNDLIHSHAREIAILVSRLLQPQGTASGRSNHKENLLRLLDTVRDDLGKHWTVRTMADLSGIYRSPDHFARLCRQELGAPPLTLVTRMRMRKAAELLTCTGYTLDTMAGMLGYGTPYALSAAFKREYGKSPDAYRRENSVSG